MSTGRPGLPNATLSTTFAVLRPTPGSATSSFIVLGISPPWRSTTARAIPSRLRDFALKKPVERIISCSSPSSAPASATASGKRSKSAGVTELIILSVLCAERIVATSSS